VQVTISQLREKSPAPSVGAGDNDSIIGVIMGNVPAWALLLLGGAVFMIALRLLSGTVRRARRFLKNSSELVFIILIFSAVFWLIQKFIGGL